MPKTVRLKLRSANPHLAAAGFLYVTPAPPADPPDARGFFDLFVEQFEGRKISFEPIGDRVRLSSADAMEFLYTYTWGPQSFPYEVREQYGVLIGTGRTDCAPPGGRHCGRDRGAPRPWRPEGAAGPRARAIQP